MESVACVDLPRGLTLNQPTLLERLEARKRDCQEKLDSLDKAIEFIKKNPELQNFMDCMQRVGI